MKTTRWLAVIAALIIVAPSLASSPADARAGAGGSSGSRGGKTGQAPAPTQTAPSAKPIERSATPAQKPATAAPASAAAQPGGFMARNPFLSGLMGGMLGAGLIGMMFGGGFAGGLGGAAGMLGLLVQLLLIGGLAYLAVRLWRARSGAQAQPAHAYSAATPRMAEPPMARQGLGAGPGAGAGMAALAGTVSAQLAITTEDYTAFETLLADVQAAYSKGDLAKLRGLATPEMLGYFSEELSADASRGVENKVEAVKLEQGDLSEAWSEAGIDYATVAMRFSMIDVTRSLADGRIVAGSDTVRTEATEIWTFLRSRGGEWILSAIQQS
ncbi:MAG: Tim44 domain-containing protein [Reyranella sp.]|uniref:Tim44 domain-containing protein n=1 Tax=Reyranella sp. TaxID=1929291 RepID=UPI001224985B|nr:Tim44 domain-containing protein [Reyranella sp.]TAJ40088.1 MAG: Tim44 domain-containing protein [Reyranella sp.]